MSFVARILSDQRDRLIADGDIEAAAKLVQPIADANAAAAAEKALLKKLMPQS